MRSLVWTEKAKEQITTVFEYSKEQFGVKVATKIVQDINKHVRLLKGHPFLGTIERGLCSRNEYRSIIRRHCKIYYTIEPDSVRIALIWDTRQNPQQLKSLL